MKTHLAFICILVFSRTHSVVQIETGLLARVVEITADSKMTAGTAFLVDHNKQTYLVTARHVFERAKFPAQASVSLRTANAWVPFRTVVSYSKLFDLAVMTAPPQLAPAGTEGIPICTRNLDLNEMFIFMGYPFNLHTEAPGVKELRANALPYLKHAMSSGSLPVDAIHNLMVLDGINNEGFSGGPLLAKDTNPLHFCVAGVVTAYRYSYALIYDEKETPTGSTVRENTGLMYAVPSSAIAETIEQSAHVD